MSERKRLILSDMTALHTELRNARAGEFAAAILRGIFRRVIGGAGEELIIFIYKSRFREIPAFYAACRRKQTKFRLLMPPTLQTWLMDGILFK
jgi:hypothetical protein